MPTRAAIKTLKSQHVIEFRAENVKRISVVEFQPKNKNGTVVISGKNGAGKSSAIDALKMVLLGKKSFPKKPIREGEERLEVILKTEDLKVTLRATNNSESLIVENHDGFKYKTPQKLLQAMLAPIAFDPMEFAMLKEKEQLEQLLKICPIDFDLDKSTEEINRAESMRRDAGRNLKTALAKIDGKPKPDSIPEQISSTDLLNKLSYLTEEEQRQERVKENLFSLKQGINDVEVEIKELEKTLESLKGNLLTLKEEKKSLIIQIQNFKDTANEKEKIQSEIETVDERNLSIQATRELKRLWDECEERRKIHEDENRRLIELRSKRSEAIKTAKFPIPTLSINDENQVLLNGNPLNQCSSSEQIAVGIALAAQANPKIKIAFIKHGSLLDTESMETIDRIAKENDLQIIVERVEEENPAAVHIVEGTNLK